MAAEVAVGRMSPKRGVATANDAKTRCCVRLKTTAASQLLVVREVNRSVVAVVLGVDVGAIPVDDQAQDDQALDTEIQGAQIQGTEIQSGQIQDGQLAVVGVALAVDLLAVVVPKVVARTMETSVETRVVVALALKNVVTDTAALRGAEVTGHDQKVAIGTLVQGAVRVLAAATLVSGGVQPTTEADRDVAAVAEAKAPARSTS